MLGMALALPAAQQGRAPSEAQLKALTDNIQRLQRQVQRDVVEKNRLSRDLRDAERAVSSAQGELARLRAERATRTEALAGLKRERRAREAERDRTAAALSGQMRAAYFMGRNEPLKLLLNQRSPAQFSRNLAYYGYLGRLRADQIASIKANIASIDELAGTIEAEEAELARLEEQQKERVGELDSARDKRSVMLARLTRESSDRNAELQRKRQERTQLERLLEQLRRETRALPYDPNAPFARTRGRLHWPVAGKISVNYGATVSGLGRSEGIEIDTNGGNVTAVHEGRVIYADWHPGRGLLVILDHGNGYWTLYGHLGELYRGEGSSVKAGDAIGTAGDSGGRKRTGLYFELRHAAKAGETPKPINPGGWFRTAVPPSG